MDPDAADVACTMIESHMYRHLVDFDNHLDDISLDWRNLGVEEQIEHCT
jgi:Uncharacterised protein family (UPF0172)